MSPAAAMRCTVVYGSSGPLERGWGGPRSTRKTSRSAAVSAAKAIDSGSTESLDRRTDGCGGDELRQHSTSVGHAATHPQPTPRAGAERIRPAHHARRGAGAGGHALHEATHLAPHFGW